MFAENKTKIPIFVKMNKKQKIQIWFIIIMLLIHDNQSFMDI